jgi:hypothetical protein
MDLTHALLSTNAAANTLGQASIRVHKLERGYYQFVINDLVRDCCVSRPLNAAELHQLLYLLGVDALRWRSTNVLLGGT